MSLEIFQNKQIADKSRLIHITSQLDLKIGPLLYSTRDLLQNSSSLLML